MYRRVLVLIGALVFVCAFGVLSPTAVNAACVPDLSAGDDSIVCDDTTLVGIGDQIAAFLNGTGNISANGDITVVSGNNAIGLVLIGVGNINSTGNLQIVGGANAIAIVLIGEGDITSTGNVTVVGGSIALGQILLGLGDLNQTGDVTVIGGDLALGQLLLGEGDINTTGDVQVVGGSVALGQILLGMGDLTNNGDVQVVGGDLALGQLVLGLGNLTNNGDLQVVSGTLALGQVLLGLGDVTNTGDVQVIAGTLALGQGLIGYGDVTAGGDVLVVGGLAGIGQGLIGYGDVTANGDMQVVGGAISLGQVLIGVGNITANGDIEIASGGIGVGQLLIGLGDITANGDITVNQGVGILHIGNGHITTNGDINVANGIGILGGPGNQIVEVDGEVHAPLAIVLDGGNDVLYFRSNANVQGWVGVGDGDDVVIIGDHAVVTNTIWGGDTGEVNGDLLVIGDGQVCYEDADAVAAAQAFAKGLASLDPENGTVTYLGQTYSWLEFEQLISGSYYAQCVGKINDGRINAYDLGAPDALYCTVEGGVSVWEINLEGQGTFSFAISAEQIAAAFEAAVSSGANQVIASDSYGNVLYALSDGQNITFTAPELREEGKTYTFMFDKGRCAIPAE